jgi:formylmethanofuran dehydrogenase subunit C
MLVVNELLVGKVTIAGSVDARIVNELLAVKVTIAGSVDARS